MTKRPSGYVCMCVLNWITRNQSIHCVGKCTAKTILPFLYHTVNKRVCFYIIGAIHVTGFVALLGSGARKMKRELRAWRFNGLLQLSTKCDLYYCFLRVNKTDQTVMPRRYSFRSSFNYGKEIISTKSSEFGWSKYGRINRPYKHLRDGEWNGKEKY